MTCRLCSQDLTIELDVEDFDEATSSSVGVSQKTPDDLLLKACNCHFHWQCLLDESASVAIDFKCPSCHASIISGSAPSVRVLTIYINEGGIQDDLDIHPLIVEEAYLYANPAARPARAFMTMCAEGDVAGILELVKAIEEDRDSEDMSPAQLLRYQDPLDGGMTGLHVAVEKSQQEVFWLLLCLASNIPIDAFPHEVVQLAQSMGAARYPGSEGDIREIRDQQGRTAADITSSMGLNWTGLLS
ncbi:hypothetical protein GLAREA_04615 [Glarea lozoyensis ATCC 20868]|uniref:Uncharacterized protein n=1 Tax=Glarea lozoyensis (strain ATCC 20868 / MF5171) TaxID=1116229 RepID=S3CRZ5_GLAL2|nr:uncharacterized protein GLAREA_04615 [Glarea lozoyensis ATCC 20868]EPE27824.1 hypothetical protein GLAREA_04615 [Glarea lozoyensis ATCC 20868]